MVNSIFKCSECTKSFKSEKALRSHAFYHSMSEEELEQHKATRAANLRAADKPCQYCSRTIGASNYKRHTAFCYMNPENRRDCEVCGEPVKNFKTSATCGYSCANKKFKQGTDNGNWKGNSYRSICFLHHEKKCIVCGEERIVEVHHYDENHNNNNPANLVPLCPTHHQYWHSRHKTVIQVTVDNYVQEFKRKMAG